MGANTVGSAADPRESDCSYPFAIEALRPVDGAIGTDPLQRDAPDLPIRRGQAVPGEYDVACRVLHGHPEGSGAAFAGAVPHPDSDRLSNVSGVPRGVHQHQRRRRRGDQGNPECQHHDKQCGGRAPLAGRAAPTGWGQGGTRCGGCGPGAEAEMSSHWVVPQTVVVRAGARGMRTVRSRSPPPPRKSCPSAHLVLWR